MNLFLETSHKALKNITHYKKVHVVIGNESCDLDSVVSSLMYAFFLYKRFRCERDASHVLVVPIMNVLEEEFPLKTESNYFLTKNKISIVNLSFRDHIDLSKCGNLVLSLVDHHVLADRDAHLSSCIGEIIDHRPLEKDFIKINTCERTRVDQVGSCCTLIADMILSEESDILSEEMACLLRGTILLDTVNFNKEANRFKDLDVRVINKLECMFGMEGCRDSVYEELVRARTDVSELSALQVLLKDMKLVQGVPVPGVPMLVSDFLLRADALAALRQLCVRCDSATLVVVGLDASGDAVRRDVAVFAADERDDHIYDRLLAAMNDDAGHNLNLEQTPTNIQGLILFQQRNVTMSRKHIIPIINTALYTDT